MWRMGQPISIRRWAISLSSPALGRRRRPADEGAAVQHRRLAGAVDAGELGIGALDRLRRVQVDELDARALENRHQRLVVAHHRVEIGEPLGEDEEAGVFLDHRRGGLGPRSAAGRERCAACQARSGRPSDGPMSPRAHPYSRCRRAAAAVCPFHKAGCGRARRRATAGLYPIASPWAPSRRWSWCPPVQIDGPLSRTKGSVEQAGPRPLTLPPSKAISSTSMPRFSSLSRVRGQPAVMMRRPGRMAHTLHA